MKRYPNFSRLLNEHLHRTDRSSTWLARQLEINVSSVSRWLSEETRPGSPDKVAEIATALQLSTEQRHALFAAANYSYSESPPSLTSTAHSVESARDFTSPTQTQSPPTPHLVPPLPPQGVFGRANLLANLIPQLTSAAQSSVGAVPVALQGMGGIGKTTLSIAIGQDRTVRHAFPDGVLWAALGPRPNVRYLLERWGNALGVDLMSERDETACQDRLRSLLQNKRMLLLVDDVWETVHGNYFLVGGPSCRTLFTTRELPIAHALATRASTVKVDLLSPTDAVAMLRSLVPEMTNGDQQLVFSLCQRLEYLPLALSLAGGLLANLADVPTAMQRLLDELIEQRAARLHLLQQHGRLGINEDAPVSLHAILGMSVERLEPVEQERFAMLSVFGAEPLTWQLDAVAHVWECSEIEAEKTLLRLIQRGIVGVRGSSFWMHALLADYAAELCESIGL